MEVGAGWKRGLVVVWEELLGQEWEQAVLVVLAVMVVLVVLQASHSCALLAT
jgi:hypothetical protein